MIQVFTEMHFRTDYNNKEKSPRLDRFNEWNLLSSFFVLVIW